jgi:hypothetical protein
MGDFVVFPCQGIIFCSWYLTQFTFHDKLQIEIFLFTTISCNSGAFPAAIRHCVGIKSPGSYSTLYIPAATRLSPGSYSPKSRQLLALKSPGS